MCFSLELEKRFYTFLKVISGIVRKKREEIVDVLEFGLFLKAYLQVKEKGYRFVFMA